MLRDLNPSHPRISSCGFGVNLQPNAVHWPKRFSDECYGSLPVQGLGMSGHWRESITVESEDKELSIR